MFEDELALLDEQEHEGGGEYDTGSGYHQLVNTPLLTLSALQQYPEYFPSRGLLGLNYGKRIYLNTNAPNSGVVCGVQGSGKSHTLSCILENALIPSPHIGALPEPLAALIFHFDRQECGQPCEAAFLASPSDTTSGTTSVPKVSVLCSPSNLTRRTRAYSTVANVQVVPMNLSEQDLTVDRTLSLMGCDNLDDIPIYANTVLRIMRLMEVDGFTYSEFKRQLAYERLDSTQMEMLKLRLDLLDSLLRPESLNIRSHFAAGEIVLVDLTDPFLDGTTAGLLFDIVLDSFVTWEAACGKIVVLDEAHKFMTSSEMSRLNQSLANTIRLQRHLATRVIIATQEPTVITRTILDLSSFIICHRFSSLSWCNYLANYVSSSQSQDADKWFQKVMMLATGECIVFSPTALVGVDDEGEIELLSGQFLEVRVRPRLTQDGGRSLVEVSRVMETLNVTEATTSIAENIQLVAPGEVMLPQDAPSAISSSSSRTHAFPTFLRDQKTQIAHQPSPPNSMEDDRQPLEADGYDPQLPFRQFLAEAEAKGLIARSSNRNARQAFLPPAPRVISSTYPGRHAPNAEVPARFRVLVAFLRQQHESGVARVLFTTTAQHVTLRLSATGVHMKFKSFIEGAKRSGIVRSEGKGGKQWIALTPAVLRRRPDVLPVLAQPVVPVLNAVSPPASWNNGFPGAPSAVSPSQPTQQPTAQPSQPQTPPQTSLTYPDMHASNIGVPDRFRVLVAFLRQQHGCGAPRVLFKIVGQHVSLRLSANGTHMKFEDFIEDARREGIVSSGGGGSGKWIILNRKRF